MEKKGKNMDFKELGINESLINGLHAQGINSPTLIQEKVIPEMLKRKNIIAKS